MTEELTPQTQTSPWRQRTWHFQGGNLTAEIWHVIVTQQPQSRTGRLIGWHFLYLHLYYPGQGVKMTFWLEKARPVRRETTPPLTGLVSTGVRWEVREPVEKGPSPAPLIFPHPPVMCEHQPHYISHRGNFKNNVSLTDLRIRIFKQKPKCHYQPMPMNDAHLQFSLFFKCQHSLHKDVNCGTATGWDECSALQIFKNKLNFCNCLQSSAGPYWARQVGEHSNLKQTS